jgi:hypothetical protein
MLVIGCLKSEVSTLHPSDLAARFSVASVTDVFFGSSSRWTAARDVRIRAEKGVGPFFLHFEARLGRCIIFCRAPVPGADGQGLQIAARFRHSAFFKALTIASALARSL